MNALPFLAEILRRSTFAFIVVAALSSLACSDDVGSSTEKETGPIEVTIKGDQGIVFETGEVVDGGPPFSKTDLYATTNGTALKLATGAAKSTVHGAAITWFEQGGIPRKWNNLAEVPKTTPQDSLTAPLLKAQQGIGFVAKNYLSDGYTRGWIKAATSETLTIVYEPLQ